MNISDDIVIKLCDDMSMADLESFIKVQNKNYILCQNIL